MEDWDSLLKSYSPPSDAKDFLRIIRIAEFTLVKELAAFEEDYILQTLIKEPVCIIDLLKKKNTDPSWSKTISDGLKLLADVVMKFKLPDEYFKMITDLCSLPYDAQTNQQALNCLTCVVKRSQYGVNDVNRYLYSLELGTSCKAQLAVYVGTICEYHPDKVADNINTIWRVFLNLFDTGKYSTPVVKAVLQGIRGLLKHFGNDLPVMELNMFYDKLLPCFGIERCADVCASILGEFAALFHERLRDRPVRAPLWARLGSPAARGALRAVCTEMDIDSPQEVIKEIKSNAESQDMNRRLTALSIMKDLQERGVHVDVWEYVDLAELEFKLRNGTVTYDCADAICWCIDAGAPHSDRLLRAALVSYDAVPTGRRRQILHSLLTYAPDRRPEVIEFLISETCRCPERFMPVWRELLEAGDAAACVRDVVSAARRVLDGPVWVDLLPEHVHLLRLIYEVVRHGADGTLARPLLRRARSLCEATPAAVLACYHYREQPALNIDAFTCDTSLINCGAALVRAPDVSAHPPAQLLQFIQILFTSKCDAATLSSALHKLEQLLSREKTLDDHILDAVYESIRKIASSKAEARDERILRRDAIIFLGKHTRNNSAAVRSDVALMTSLKEYLFLNIPDNNTQIKLQLHKILYLALVDENEMAVRALLHVICQCLSLHKEPLLQSALIRVLTLLSRYSIDLDTLKSCLSYCDSTSAPELIKCLSQEKFPGSRDILLQGLEMLLTLDLDEQVVEEILEQTLLCDELHKNEADILKLILKVLTNNNTLIQKYIIKIIYKGTKCDPELTKMATEILVNKINLFDKITIQDVICKMLEILSNIKYTDSIKVITNIIVLIKTLTEHTESNKYEILSNFIKLERLNLYALSCLKRGFDLSEDQYQDLYMKNESHIKENLFENDTFNKLEEKMEFMVEFSNTLLLEYDAIYFLCKVINNLSPNIGIKIQDNLSKCLKTIRESKQEDQIRAIFKSFNEWITKLPLAEIAQNLVDYKFGLEDEEILNTIKILTKDFNEGLTVHKQSLMRILDLIKKLFTSGYIERCLESKMEYLMDLVEVAMIVDREELKRILKEPSGIQFCQTFIRAVHSQLTRKPYLLLDVEVKDAAILLNDIVKISHNNDNIENILELVDELWPTYVSISTFSQRHSLLLDLSRSSAQLPPESNPMRWLLTTLGSEGTKTNERILLLEVIPGGEEYDPAYLSVTSRLPTRVREVRGPLSSYLRAIFECFAKHRSRKLLEVIVNLASGDDTRGWWDDAMAVTMYAVSAHEDASVCAALYRRCWDVSALGACRRLLVPLLRFSSASFCEEVFSWALPELVSALERRPRAPSTHYTYHKYIHDATKAFTLLEVLFQKVPKHSIESPTSHLYHKMTDKVGDSLYWVVKTACKLGLTLKKVVTCPDGADEKMKNSYRLFHCANYNCVVSALCCRDPGMDVYATVFDKSTWVELIDTERLYLPLKYQWNRSSAHYTAPPPGATRLGSASLTSRTSLTSLTSLTRDFTHTLSENPLQYDLQETQVLAQEAPAGDDPLSRHECGAALALLLRAVAPRPALRPLQLLAAALADTQLHCNAKWLLAQAICNCKEELKQHASVLRPALLVVTANTAADVLNSVHVDIVDTIILWHDGEELPASCVDNLNNTVQHLISTYLKYRNRSVLRNLLEKLEKLLQLYATSLTISGQFFKDQIVDFKSEIAKRCVQVLKRITTAKVHIPELLPTVVQAMEGRRTSPDVCELLGLALANTNQNAEAKQTFRSMLERLRRSDVAEYIKLLYYTQKGYPACCDENNFKVISDLMPKIVGRDRQKCLHILAGCVGVAPRDVGAGLRDVRALPLCDVVGEEAGLNLVRHCLPLLQEDQRRELVLRVAGLCDSPSRERPAALRVIVKAFALLITPEASEPALKRRAESSVICNLLKCTDGYVTTVMPLVGEALSEEDARRDVGKHLSVESIVRFCECFVLAVYFPTTSGRTSNTPRAMGNALTLFFSGLRQQEAYQTVQRATYADNTRTPSNRSMVNLPEAELHDQSVKKMETKTLDEILDDILKYALDSPSVAAVLCAQLTRTFRGTRRPGFDFDETLYDVLTRVLGSVSEITPWVMEVLMALRCWEPSLKHTVEKLCRVTVDSEAQDLCKAFKEDYQLYTLGCEYLILGFPSDDDIVMSENTNFSIEDLVSTFDKLSDWDNVPIQQRNKVKGALPPLWTDNDTFKLAIRDFQGNNAPAWFKSMVEVCRGGGADRLCHRGYDRWPRKLFDVSAMVELLDWEKLRDEGEVRLPYYHPSECIAKVAARLMIRRAFLDSIGVSGQYIGDALRVCERACGAGLHALARACCVGLADLPDGDSIKLFELKITSERGLAMEKRDATYLESALHSLEQMIDTFADTPNLGHMWRVRRQTLLVKRDMRSLSKVQVETPITDIMENVKSREGRSVSKQNTEVLSSICIIGVTQFNSFWDNSEPSEQDDLMKNMCKILNLYLEQNLGSKWRLILDVILSRLDDMKDTLSEETALYFLNQVQYIPELDDFSKDLIRCNINALPSHLRDALSLLQSDDDVTRKLKKCFQLVAGAGHLLRDYCRRLGDALRDNDETLWSHILKNVKERIFENPYAGADYQVLHKYKKVLYQMDKFEPDNEDSRRQLSEIVSELRSDKTSLSLPQLCPALCGDWSPEEGRGLARLMGLRGGLRVVKFYNKVPVFCGAVRRPAVLRARLSDGSARRVLVKSGERAHQAAAMRVMRAVHQIYPTAVTTHYWVTVVSDDCSIIEYLEDRVRLRSLVASEHPIDDTLLTAQRAQSKELILSPKGALQQYQEICGKIPATLLRSAIQSSSITIEDFIIKKKNFLESVSVMSIATCILGVGDRHLENILYGGGGGAGGEAGGVVHVDWAALLQFGAHELPPARLTRNVLAVCDIPALESRMQQLTSALRDNHELVLSTFKVAFKWMRDDFLGKYVYIEGLVRGTMLCHHVTRDVIGSSDRPYRDKYVQLLDEVFQNFPKKEHFEVEEQVSSILRQSTDPRILSVVRTGWEPWI